MSLVGALRPETFDGFQCSSADAIVDAVPDFRVLVFGDTHLVALCVQSRVIFTSSRCFADLGRLRDLLLAKREPASGLLVVRRYCIRPYAPNHRNLLQGRKRVEHARAVEDDDGGNSFNLRELDLRVVDPCFQVVWSAAPGIGGRELGLRPRRSTVVASVHILLAPLVLALTTHFRGVVE